MILFLEVVKMSCTVNKHIAICKDCRGHCFVLHKRSQSEGKYPMTKELSGRSEQFRPPFFCL